MRVALFHLALASLALLGLRRVRVLPLALVSVALAAIFSYISMTDNQQFGISARPATYLAQAAVALPVAAATLAFAALAVSAGGALKAGKTTKLLSGAEWVAALKKAPAVSAKYKPAK